MQQTAQGQRSTAGLTEEHWLEGVMQSEGAASSLIAFMFTMNPATERKRGTINTHHSSVRACCERENFKKQVIVFCWCVASRCKKGSLL